jgi:CPA2 family monovalent cation:H+ antiporter-2
MGLFFITVGMKLDLSIAAATPLAVVAWVSLLTFGKAGIIAAVAAILRWPAEESARLAMILAHGGEFGLLLLTQAMAVGIIEAGTAQPALVAVALTMGLAPILIQHHGWAGRLLSIKPMALAADEAPNGMVLDRHVVLCGYGRVGRLVALALETAKVAYVAIESDIARFHEAKDLGHSAIFGDASSGRILDTAGIACARLIIVTFDRGSSVERIIHHARQRNPDVLLLVSAAEDREIKHLAAAGATAVFPENLAAGLALADQALLLVGLSQQDAAGVISAMRSRLNPELLGQVGV